MSRLSQRCDLWRVGLIKYMGGCAQVICKYCATLPKEFQHSLILVSWEGQGRDGFLESNPTWLTRDEGKPQGTTTSWGKQIKEKLPGLQPESPYLKGRNHRWEE